MIAPSPSFDLTSPHLTLTHRLHVALPTDYTCNYPPITRGITHRSHVELPIYIAGLPSGRPTEGIHNRHRRRRRRTPRTRNRWLGVGTTTAPAVGRADPAPRRAAHDAGEVLMISAVITYDLGGDYI